MTSLELTKSILEFHCKTQLELYTKPTNIDIVRKQGQEQYGSPEAFIEYRKTKDDSYNGPEISDGRPDHNEVGSKGEDIRQKKPAAFRNFYVGRRPVNV